MGSHGPEINEKIARLTIDTNYYGIKNVTDSLLPLLKGGRVVNVTSTAGVIHDGYAKDLKEKFLSNSLKVEDVDGLVEKFVHDVKDGEFKERGWPASTYRVSKAAANVLTRIYARDLKEINFYCCCPGFVKTDMSSGGGTKTPDEGAETPVWLATADEKELQNGKFYRDNKLMDF
jgi:carbonyl reductase 1